MTATSEPVFFNPLEAGYIENPWPHLAEIRNADPVHHLITGQWGSFDTTTSSPCSATGI